MRDRATLRMIFADRSLLQIRGLSYFATLALLLAAPSPSGFLLARSQTLNPEQEYRNPALFADYSDPDVIRDGNHFYMVSSSFEFVPGLPVLESGHWCIGGSPPISCIA